MNATTAEGKQLAHHTAHAAERFAFRSTVTHTDLPELGVVKDGWTTPATEHGPAVEWVAAKLQLADTD